MGHGIHEQGAADSDTPSAHDAGSTEIERNDKTEVNQQDDSPAPTSTDNGDAAQADDQVAGGARTDDHSPSGGDDSAPTSTSAGDANGVDDATGTSGPPAGGDDTAPLVPPTAPTPPPTNALAGSPVTQPAYEARTTPSPTTTTPTPESPRRAGAYADSERPLTRPQPTSGEQPSPPARPRHFRQPPVSKPAGVDPDERRRRRNLLLAISPVFIVVLIVVAWAVDTVTLSGQVLRNVTLAGDEIGGSGEDSLSEQVADMADEIASRQVVIEVQPATSGFAGGQSAEAAPRRYETTAGDLGLTLDEEATVEAALDMGRGDMLLVRPFKWLASYMSSREAPLKFRMNEAQTVAALQILQGTDQTAPVEPTIQLQNNEFVAVAGHAGTGLNADDVAESLLAAVEEADSLDSAIEITGHQTDVAPNISDQEAEEAAAEANQMTATGLTLKAADVSATVPPEQLRAWMGAVVVEEGNDFHLDLTFNNEAATQAAPGVLAELAAEPQNATVVMQGGQPTVQPGRPGATCCGAEAGAQMWEALQAGQTEVTYEVETQDPEYTTEEVQGWGITEPIGGARAHRNGADIAGPTTGYTTYHDCCAARVTNIHRIAQETNGAIIPPGGTFSLNDHVGERTTADGYVSAGAIRDGEHVDEVGGGVSQFFTTLFNAAYFGGLDILEYQTHSENFSRYPDGREATGGWRNPDLVLRNDTPYGMMIQTSTTDTSVTVTLWSTPYITAEQTGLSSSPSGAVCTTVTSTRTRTWPDGRTERDSFRGTYRPTGQFCDGTPVTTTTTLPPG